MQPFGKYRLLERLASGGMAEVYRAEVPGAAGFVKQVAVKLIRSEFSEQPDFVEMFIQEARLASKLNHANIVQVFDFDQVNGRYYIAMEYVHGRTLRQLVNSSRSQAIRLGLPRLVHIGAEVAKALAYAHRLTDQGQPLGIVHRDVSPQNILISFEGEVKLADFGIAHAVGATSLTQTGAIKGKLAYMAPEQARAEPVDARTDLFALGVILWELCCGRPLFARANDAATLAAVVGPEPTITPPTDWNPLVSPDLATAIMGVLERDREKRTQSSQEFVDQLSSARLALMSSAKDIDLREVMHQLWPDAGAPRPLPVEPTLQRPVTQVPPTKPSPPPDIPSENAETFTAMTEPSRPQVRWRKPVLFAAFWLLVLVAGATTWRFIRHQMTLEATRPESPVSTPASAVAAPATPQLPLAVPAETPRVTPVPPEEEGPTAARTLTELPNEPAGSSPLLDSSQGQGLVRVDAQPWALLFVDGKRIGVTPRELTLPAGRHQAQLQRDGYVALEKDFILTPGGAFSWNPKLFRMSTKPPQPVVQP